MQLAEALSTCDVAKARKVIHDHRVIRDLDIDALTANAVVCDSSTGGARPALRADAVACGV